MEMLSTGEHDTLCVQEGEGGRAGRAVDISFLSHACGTLRGHPRMRPLIPSGVSNS